MEEFKPNQNILNINLQEVREKKKNTILQTIGDKKKYKSV